MVSIDFLGTSTIFSTLHGSLWLGKDEGSIMERAESGGTIYLDLHRMDTLVTIR